MVDSDEVIMNHVPKLIAVSHPLFYDENRDFALELAKKLFKHKVTKTRVTYIDK